MLPIFLLIKDENDRRFVEGVYSKYKERLVCKARVFLNNEHDVEECIQDVFIVLIDNLEQCYEWDEDHMKNFLMKCVRCIAINKYKENMRRYVHEFSVNEFEYENDMEFDIPDSDENIERTVISEENVKRIAQMLDEMDNIYSDILYFRFFLGMKNIEIAKMLDIPVNTVNQRIARGKRTLLEKRGTEINEILGK